MHNFSDWQVEVEDSLYNVELGVYHENEISNQVTTTIIVNIVNIIVMFIVLIVIISAAS